MNDISKARFDALASYCRHPLAAAISTEFRWLEIGEERVLATLLQDAADGDFAAIIFARDLKARYRWIEMSGFFASPEEALSAAEQKATTVLATLDAEREQGDEHGPPMDFFRPVRALERLNADFVRLATEEGLSPARGIIEPMMRWYEDPDRNFVEQFQTTGFDARIWELYLFAALREAGFIIDRPVPAPDFVAKGLLGEFGAEATTINPTRDDHGNQVPPPARDTPEEQLRYVREYLPVRYAGPLTAKLGRRYWEQPDVREKPLVFAIQDFHAPMSMVSSRSGLPTYLYGYFHHARRERDGSLTIVPERVTVHRWGTKEVTSGFFMLPEAENVSAVVFNSSATISKFNRLGLIAGFGSGRVSLTRFGLVIDHDAKAAVPRPFVQDIDETYVESWIEGMDVYHNPQAKYPLDPALLNGAAHHRLLPDGQIESTTPAWQPLASVTTITVGDASTVDDGRAGNQHEN